MKNQAAMSNCRDPDNRSRKRCCCGGHSSRKRRRWSRARINDALESSVDAKRYNPYWRLDAYEIAD